MENTEPITPVLSNEERIAKLEKSVKWMKIMRNISFTIIILGIAGYSISTIAKNVNKAI